MASTTTQLSKIVDEKLYSQIGTKQPGAKSQQRDRTPNGRHGTTGASQASAPLQVKQGVQKNSHKGNPSQSAFEELAQGAAFQGGKGALPLE